MSGTAFDGILKGRGFADADVARRFSGNAELPAMPIDPGALAAKTGLNSVPAPVAAARTEMQVPGYARWPHHGATSQDAGATRLRCACDGHSA